MSTSHHTPQRTSSSGWCAGIGERDKACFRRAGPCNKLEETAQVLRGRTTLPGHGTAPAVTKVVRCAGQLLAQPPEAIGDARYSCAVRREVPSSLQLQQERLVIRMQNNVEDGVTERTNGTGKKTAAGGCSVG